MVKNKSSSNKKLLIVICVIILVLALIIIGLLIKNKSSLTGEVISGNVIGITGDVVGLPPNDCDRDSDCPRTEVCYDSSQGDYCVECYTTSFFNVEGCNIGEICKKPSSDPYSWYCESTGGGAICGNGIEETGEECDDRNTVNGDGCSSSCQDEGGQDCTIPGCLACSIHNGVPTCVYADPNDCYPACGNGQVCNYDARPPECDDRECTIEGSNQECPGELICLGGMCKLCESNQDCMDGFYCENPGESDAFCKPMSNACKRGESICVSDTEYKKCKFAFSGYKFGPIKSCDTGNNCVEEIAKKAKCIPSTDIGCSYENPCPLGEICIGHQCQPKQECDYQNPCPEGWYCGEGTCKPLQCNENKPCALGMICIPDVGCRPDPNAPKPHCYDGLKNRDETGLDCGGKDCKECSPEEEEPECDFLNQCPNLKECINGKCVSPYPDGPTCFSGKNSECKNSGTYKYCIDNICSECNPKKNTKTASGYTLNPDCNLNKNGGIVCVAGGKGGAMCSVCLSDDECKFLSNSGILQGLNKCKKLPARSECVECIKDNDCPTNRPYCDDLFGVCDECQSDNINKLCKEGYVCDLQEIDGNWRPDLPKKCFQGDCVINDDCLKIGKNTCVDHQCI